MGQKSGIEWTDATWNPVRARAWEIQNDGSGKERFGWHCEHVSEGCRNCYAEGINLRLGTGRDFKPGELYREEKEGYINGEVKLFLDGKLLTDPLRWKRPRSVFVSSMTDVFADFVSDEMLDRMFAVMALCPQHFFRVLTKRPGRMRAYVSEISTARSTGRGEALIDIAEKCGRYPYGIELEGIRWPLPNVGLGVSVEDQASANERIPHLLATPAAMRFVSAEPLLGAVNLRRVTHRDPKQFSWLSYDPTLDALTGNYPLLDGGPRGPHPRRLHEVIAGGESGPGARPMHPDWVRGLRDQCAEVAQESDGAQSRASAQGPAFFFKQWGEWIPFAQVSGGTVEPNDNKRYWVAPDGSVQPSANTHLIEMDDAKRERHGLHPVDWCLCRRAGKKAAGALLDGREHREVAAQVTAHFERLDPYPKNQGDFSTSPQGGGDGGGEGGA